MAKIFFVGLDVIGGKLTELSQMYSRLCEATTLPVLADADTGFGNALNVQRVIRSLERAGAAAARHGRVAALDHEAGDDAVEDRVVVKAALGERDERGGGVRRGLLVDADRDVAAARLERDVVSLRRVQVLLWLPCAAVGLRRRRLDLGAAAGAALRLGAVRVGVVVAARDERNADRAQQQRQSPRHGVVG